MRIRLLGQSGVHLRIGELQLLIDPYLSNRVAELYGHEFARLKPPPFEPSSVTWADWILVTHEHEDHCDLATLLPILSRSRSARVVAPEPAARILIEAGADSQRVLVASETPLRLAADLRLVPIPAAHPRISRSRSRRLRALGYVLEHRGIRLYHSGDTSPVEEIFRAVRTAGPIDVAFLPVNERNYFRERAGIVGNMSVREAFAFAAEVGVQALVPIHWDMFAPNSVFRAEIQLLHRLLRPPFRLLMAPRTLP